MCGRRGSWNLETVRNAERAFRQLRLVQRNLIDQIVDPFPLFDSLPGYVIEIFPGNQSQSIVLQFLEPIFETFYFLLNHIFPGVGQLFLEMVVVDNEHLPPED